MKFLASIFAVVLSGQTLIAATNLIYVGDGKPSPVHVSSGQSVPWQANLVPLCILLVGLGHLFYPRVAWWFKYGWKFSGDIGPSALWLFCERLGGFAAVVVAVVIFGAMHGMLSAFIK